MATSTPIQQIINNGAFVDDPSAEAVYVSFQKAKINFSNIWKMIENQGYENIFLNLVGINTEQLETKYIADAIERGKFVGGSYGAPWEITPVGRKPLFYTITPTGSNNLSGGTPNTTLGYEYRFYRVHKKGQIYGGSGGVLVTASDISPAGSFTIGGTSNNPNAYIDLGDIGTANVWTSFNLGDAGAPWTVRGLALVTAVQNGVNRTWSFVGNRRLGIDEGEWGGSDVLDPDYLAAIEPDFDLLSNQPIVYPDLFITKSSKKYRDYTLTSATAVTVLLSPEFTTYNINVTGGAGEIKGFSADSFSITYDGTDVYFRNVGAIDLRLKHNDPTATVPFYFKTLSDVIVKPGDILQLKYNADLRVVELVGISELANMPVPFGNLRVLKIQGNSNANAIEAGDVVSSSMLNNNIFLTIGEYVSGDVMELASYDPTTVDYYDLS